MRTNKDTRGKCWYDIFPLEKGQVDAQFNYPGTIRAFHMHKNKEETWFIAEGEFKIVLSNPTEILYLSQGESVFISTNRWHGYQVLGEIPGIMIEYTTVKHIEDPEDDYKKPYNEFDNWEKEKK